jgi:ABC-type phosphate/phosphonate transport system ATPase subunit
MAYLELKGIEKFFGEHRAIKGIDLEIQPGEFVVFVGPSGTWMDVTLPRSPPLNGIWPWCSKATPCTHT